MYQVEYRQFVFIRLMCLNFRFCHMIGNFPVCILHGVLYFYILLFLYLQNEAKTSTIRQKRYQLSFPSQVYKTKQNKLVTEKNKPHRNSSIISGAR